MRQGPSLHGWLQGLVHGRSVYLLLSLLILVAIGPWLSERPSTSLFSSPD